MPQAQSSDSCICPECGYVCAACVSRNIPLSIGEIRALAEQQAFKHPENNEENP